MKSGVAPPNMVSKEMFVSEMPFQPSLHLHQCHSGSDRSRQIFTAALKDLRSSYEILDEANQAINHRNTRLLQENENLQRANEVLSLNLRQAQHTVHDLQEGRAAQHHQLQTLTADYSMLKTELIVLQSHVNSWKGNINKLIKDKSIVTDELTRTLFENDELLSQVHRLRLVRDIESHGRQRQEQRVLELEHDTDLSGLAFIQCIHHNDIGGERMSRTELLQRLTN